MHIKQLARDLRPYAFLILTIGLAACGAGSSDEPESGGNAGTLQITSTAHSLIEGTDSTVSITVSRADGSSGAASVDYVTADDSATTPTDYASTSGTLHWADGDSASKSFNIPITDDNNAEDPEAFSVNLIHATGASFGSNISTTVTISDDDPDVIHGKFIDAVVGLQYVSGDQAGKTDIDGNFDCEAGPSINFFVGDILIGAATCDELISPVDMVPGASDETHPTVSNIFAFLQTIDDDNNPDNGITITQVVIDAAMGYSINFEQTTEDFKSDPNVINIVAALTAVTTAGVHGLVDSSAAESDLNSILLSEMAGIYNGTYTCSEPCTATGTWSMTIDEDGTLAGSVCNLDTQVSFPISGSITSSGISTIDASGSGGNGNFSGTVSLEGEFIGSWSTANNSGPFIGSRQGISVGGNCILPGGNLDITGTDTSTIGFSFIPVYDGLSLVTDTQINIIAFDINPFISPDLDTRTIEIIFDTAGTPLAILFRFYSSGISAANIWGEYVKICSQDDCSDVTINTATQTVNLSNVTIFPTNMSGNNATDTVTLDGSFIYTLSTP